MKRYGICFLFLTTAVLCFLAGGFVYTAKLEKTMQAPPLSSEQEAVKLSGQQVQQQNGEEEPVEEQTQEVIPANQPSPQAITTEGEYYLVEESGFLLVFCKDKTTLCLHTHMPVTDFPVSEQERLAEGIWFPTMLDVFQCLESYTS